jgi:acetyl-CoA carboxylase biotin carboxyl carrier protein
MDLTNEDVADILALLDSLPYDELDLQTPRFRLTLRRTPDGWTQAAETRAAPSVVEVAAGTVLPASPGLADPSAATPMGHRGRYGSTNGPSVLPGGGEERADDGTDGGDGGDGDGGDGEVDRGLVAVRAPLPGTFYRAPRPGAAPFVEVGSRVGANSVVGIVETMKLMNPVTAGVDGTVAEICLGNAEFAALGATLLRIRAD